MLKLSKIKPAETVTFQADSCTLNFMEMSQTFRNVRKRSRNPMDKCHWCKHPFVDGEMMALAFTRRGNKTLCQACAKSLMESKQS